jgi:hypothetical protein
MLTVVNKSLIHYAAEEALEAGIEQIIVVTGLNKTAIENRFDIAYQPEDTLRARDRRGRSFRRAAPRRADRRRLRAADGGRVRPGRRQRWRCWTRTRRAPAGDPADRRDGG